MEKIILFGSTGMLGSYIYTYFSKNTSLRVVPIHFRISQNSLNHLEDILVKNELDEKTCIINCIGQIPQRKGENFKEDTYFLVNSIFPQVLWNICKHYGAKMIHPTTDCVFSGKKIEGNYLETDIHDEIGAYGMSKSLGEPLGCTVIRTSIIGKELQNKKSFLEWVLSSIKEEDSIKGWNNHRWNGITCLEYCKFLEKIIKDGNFWQGIRHIYCPTSKSKYEMVCMIVDVFKREDQQIEIKCMDSSEIVNKTLFSIYEISYSVQELRKQIEELKEFELCLP